MNPFITMRSIPPKIIGWVEVGGNIWERAQEPDEGRISLPCTVNIDPRFPGMEQSAKLEDLASKSETACVNWNIWHARKEKKKTISREAWANVDDLQTACQNVKDAGCCLCGLQGENEQELATYLQQCLHLLTPNWNQRKAIAGRW